MTTNDTLYKITKALSLTQDDIIKAYELEGFKMDSKQLESLLAKRQDKDFKVCSFEELGVFLDGLVTLKRGESSKKNDSSDVELSNNLIIKKLRIALELKEAETEIIFSLGEASLSKQQLSSLFRKDSHKNFKECSDELLESFLDGLDEFYFVGDDI